MKLGFLSSRCVIASSSNIKSKDARHMGNLKNVNG